MNGRDVVRLVLLSAPRRPIVTKHAHRTFGVPLRVNCSCATRKPLRGPLLSVKNASPCADLELATHSRKPSSRRWRTRCRIAQLGLLLFVSSCPSNQLPSQAETWCFADRFASAPVHGGGLRPP